MEPKLTCIGGNRGHIARNCTVRSPGYGGAGGGPAGGAGGYGGGGSSNGPQCFSCVSLDIDDENTDIHRVATVI
jgi:hypothetical protein